MSNANQKNVVSKNDVVESVRSHGDCNIGFHAGSPNVLNFTNNITDGSIAIHPRGNGAVTIESGVTGAGTGTLTLKTAGDIEFEADNINGIQPEDLVTLKNAENANLILLANENVNGYVSIDDGTANHSINIVVEPNTTATRHKIFVKLLNANSAISIQAVEDDGVTNANNKIQFFYTPDTTENGQINQIVEIERAGADVNGMFLDIMVYNNGVGVANECVVSVSSLNPSTATPNITKT